MSSEQEAKDQAEQAQTGLSRELEDSQLEEVAGGTTEPPARTEKTDTFTRTEETDRGTFRR